MRHVALLRGINVGGKSLIKMADLRECFEELGFDEVSTYIASGNVLFKASSADAAAIEEGLERRFGLPIKVVVLDQREYARIVDAIPPEWVGDATRRANVAFVRPGTDAHEAIGDLEPDPAVEEIRSVDGAILWATRRDSLNRSRIRKLLERPAYKELTIRNLNTTLKLHELLGNEG